MVSFLPSAENSSKLDWKVSCSLNPNDFATSGAAQQTSAPVSAMTLWLKMFVTFLGICQSEGESNKKGGQDQHLPFDKNNVHKKACVDTKNST